MNYFRFTPRASGGLGHPPDPGAQYRMMRSYDDADIVRRVDNSILVHDSGHEVTSGQQRVAAGQPGGHETLPRLKGTNGMKGKPVAKIIASTRTNPAENDIDWEEKCDNEIAICDKISKSGTSSPNMTLRKNRSGSDAGLQQVKLF